MLVSENVNANVGTLLFLLSQGPGRCLGDVAAARFRQCLAGTAVAPLAYVDLSARRNNGDVVRRRPSYATIHRKLENPISGGAFAYGRSGVTSGFGPSPVRPGIRRKPRDERLALIPNNHEDYVSWMRAEAIRHMVS